MSTPRLLSPRGWAVLAALAAVWLLGVPLLHLAVPAGHPLHLSEFYVGLLGKFACYAICALAIDLIWGFTGILSLGHGLFFALGGYGMGMYLMRQIGREGQYGSELPDFMVFLNWQELPWHWALSDSLPAQLFLALAVPGALAALFGWFAFRSRIQGVYFSIITQALTVAAMLLFFRNETGFGGNNGFTDFKRLAGISLQLPAMKLALCLASGLALLGCYLLARWLTQGRYGRLLLAVRDAESRLRFCGYDPVAYKLSIWVLSALMCALAGVLYVPQVGIINPSEMSPAASIEMAIWAAVGGRGTLIGPILGAFFVNGGKSVFTAWLPEVWLFVLGGLFIAVTLFLPRGLIGLIGALSRKERP
ncbi:urea ABC transporter permease subunit UrtC [Inhella proteolytica]|uniref:Urea ABC transporter permease subunit UrtC n=1 Tax=Inhella proteolytica TaxID=2795029 RepID=A0A931J4V2_9BURK|nr:urea ABC transporter permease subunit UrtC [Inhella proteolytica]MBH9577828.1 urea ABC transporter permease subunit UrtC [Inhella proteolytica]